MSNAFFSFPMAVDADSAANDSDSGSGSDDSVDVSDALFQRGDMLRKLRQLELEDEAARREAATEAVEANYDNDGDGETLNYRSYLSHQAFYDDFKHVNYKYINFGPIRDGQEPLVLQQDRSLGKGGLIWDAGFILAEHVMNEHENLPFLAPAASKPKRIVEVGAGTGVTGLILARAFPNTMHVDMTDLPELMPLIETNRKTVPNTSSFVLKWGEPVKNNGSSNGESTKYDIVIGADVVASIYDPTALLQTIDDLSHHDSWVYLSGKDRLANTIEPFELGLRQIFTHVERQPANSVNRNPGIWIMVAHGKRTNQ